MAVKSIKSQYIKNVHPSETPLGIYKDADTKSFVAFDDKGNTEEIASKQFVNSGATATVTVNSIITQNNTFTASTTVNGNVGQVSVNIQSGTALNSGSFLNITVSNSSVVANSIIILSREGGESSNKSSLSVDTKQNGSFQIKGWIGWEITPNDDFKINFIVINP